MTVSESQYLVYLTQVNALSDQTKAAFMALWPRLDHTNMDTLKESLYRYMPALVDEYGTAMSVLTAEWYDMSRDGTTPYTATTAKGETGKTVSKAINYAFSDRFTGDVTGYLAGAAVRGVMDYQRATIIENVERDPWAKGYISVARPTACAFCQVKSIASYREFRGRRLQSRIFENAWHDDCRCTLQPVGSKLPDWVIPRQAEEMYEAASKELLRRGIKERTPQTVFPVMREMFNLR